MRIAVWHNLPGGGGKRALHDQVRGLLERGHTVESWCPPTADQDFLPLGHLIHEHVVPLATVRRGSWAEIAGRASGGASSVLHTLKAMDRHCATCAEQIARGGFDLLFGGSCGLLAVTSIARHLRLPSVLYLHEPCRRLYEAMPDLPWPAQDRSGRALPVAVAKRARDVARTRALRMQAREEVLGARAYDRVLVNSLFSRESLLRAYGLEAHVCYLGVDVERFRPLGLDREPTVVGFGQFAPQKRIEVAIRAVAQMADPRPALVWMGYLVDREHLKRLQAVADRCGVAFRPMVSAPHEEVINQLNRASAMLCVSRLEPFGFGPLEAGACALPTVAIAEGGLRETVIHERTGLLVEDEDALPAALERLVSNEGLVRSLGEAARLEVEARWTLALAANRLEAHLQSVAEGGR